VTRLLASLARPSCLVELAVQRMVSLLPANRTLDASVLLVSR